MYLRRIVAALAGELDWSLDLIGSSGCRLKQSSHCRAGTWPYSLPGVRNKQAWEMAGPALNDATVLFLSEPRIDAVSDNWRLRGAMRMNDDKEGAER